MTDRGKQMTDRGKQAIDRGKQRRTNLSLERKTELHEKFRGGGGKEEERGCGRIWCHSRQRNLKYNVISKEEMTAVVP